MIAPAQSSSRKVPLARPGKSRHRIPDNDRERIVVTGPAGAGKSQLANELGARLGIRVVHLDTLF